MDMWKYSHVDRWTHGRSRQVDKWTSGQVAATTATVSQQLSPSRKTPGIQQAGTKYPGRGNPSLLGGHMDMAGITR